MIHTKQDLKEYLDADYYARFHRDRNRRKPLFIQRNLWMFNVCLRHEEYHCNNSGIVHRVLKLIYALRRRRLAYKLGWFVGCNTCGGGYVLFTPVPLL